MKRGAVTLALVLAGACRSALQPGPASRDGLIPVTRLSRDTHAFALNSGLRDSTQLVIRDSVAWRELWQQINSPFIPPPRLPAIDFAHDMIVVDALGTRSSGGYDVRIESATEDSTGIDVSVLRTAPGAGCLVTEGFTQPVDVARLPARQRPVRFHVRRIVQPCPAP